MFLTKTHLPVYRGESHKRITTFTSISVSFNISIQTSVLNLHKGEATSIQLHSSFMHYKIFTFFFTKRIKKEIIIQ